MRKTLSERLLMSSALGILSLAGTPAAYANPTGGQVVGGSANISSSGNTLTVTQTSSRAIINWQRFDISSGETTQFVQPSSNSIALNRVTGSESPSQILGTLSANGQVWIINPNGVMFGGNAQVNVAGLVATSSDIDNSRFMAGDYTFSHPGNANATISNAGTLTAADAGLVAFVAPNVTNTGLIQAKLGKVQLGSGDSFTLDLYGDGLINLQASPAVTQQIVSNSGTIQANGGQVMLTAAAAENTVNSLINMSGVIQAESIGTQNGQIVLYAAGSNAVADNDASIKGQKSGYSEVDVSGTLDASGLNEGEAGGDISVLGDHVGVLTGANINASGAAGGGTIKIGGDFHGQGTTPTALDTVVQNGANIYADALTSGNGGNVAVWSDGYTSFAGTISARGGALSGNGGYVETSGHNLMATGLVKAGAASGKGGTWLLDPNNIDIEQSSCTGTSCATADAIGAALSGGSDVTVTTTDGSITLGGTANATITDTGSTTQTLTFSAGTDIVIGSGSTSGAITASGTGKLNVVFDADTAGSGGAIVMNAGSSITSNGGSIVLAGGSNPGGLYNNSLSATGAVGDNVATQYGNGISLLGASLSAGAGNIILYGTGTNSSEGSGIQLYANAVTNSISTTSGNITLTGYGAAAGAYHNNGLSVSSGNGGTNSISTASGAITITGTAAPVAISTGQLELGIWMDTGTTVQSTGAGTVGNITFTGTGASGGDVTDGAYNFGVFVNDGTVISSADANIAITGTGLGNTAGLYNAGVVIKNSSVISSTGKGNITITGTDSANDAYVDIKGAGTASTIGNASGTGTITFIANTLLSPLDVTVETAGQVVFQPRTAGTSIGFGGTNPTGTLQVTQAIMDAVNTPTVIVGSTSAGTLTTGTFNWEHTLDNLTLIGNSVVIGGNITKGVDDGSVANSANGTLTIQSNTDITTSGALAISSSGSYGKLNVLFDADYAGAGGDILFGDGTDVTSITSNGGNITMGGGSGTITAGSGYAVGATTFAYNTGVAINADLAAGGGNVIINGKGDQTGNGNTNYGIYLGYNNISTTGNGTITLTGWGGDFSGGGSNDAGVEAISGGISTVNGNLTISGTGGGNASTGTDYGVAFVVGSTIQVTGSGNLSITGTGGDGTNSGANNYGIVVGGGSSVIAHNGSLTLNGIGGGDGTNEAGIYLNSTNNQILSTGTASITLTGTGANGTADIITPSSGDVIGGASDTGNITFNANTLSFTTLPTIQTTGTVTFAPRTDNTTISLAGGAGTLDLTTGILGAITAGSITIGDTADSGLMTVGAYSWNTPVSLLSGSGDININGEQTMGGNRFLADTASGNIVIGASGGVSSAASGTAIILADSGGDFINDDGPFALSASGGRWLIYSRAPFSDTFGGLSGVFSRYGCTYGGDCLSFPSSGNGFLYSYYNPNTLITSQMNVAVQFVTAAEAIITDAEREPLYYILPVDYAALDMGKPKASLRPSAGEEPQDQGKASITIMCSMNDNGSSMLSCSVLR